MSQKHFGCCFHGGRLLQYLSLSIPSICLVLAKKKKGSFQVILFWLVLTGADLSALAYSSIGSTIQNLELLHRLARATIVCPLPQSFLITPMTLLALKVIFFCVLLELGLYKEFPVETFAVIKNRIVRAAIIILSVSLRFLHQNHNFRQQD